MTRAAAAGCATLLIVRGAGKHYSNVRSWVILGIPWAIACGGQVSEPHDGDGPSTQMSTADPTETSTDDDSSTDAYGPGFGNGEFPTVSVDGLTVQLSVDSIEEEPQLSPMFATPLGTGSWFESPPSSTARTAELDPPRGASTHAYYLDGDAANETKSLTAYLNLKNVALDLRGYVAFGFWARFEDAAGPIHVRANPHYEGTPAPGYALGISDEWDFYFVEFEDLQIDSSAVMELELVVGDQSTSGRFWLDDFGFVCDGECPSE